MKYDLYIFDFDGTVCNSFEGFKAALCYMLNELHYPVPSDEVIRNVIGPPFAYTMEHVLGIKPSDKSKAIELYRSYFETHGHQLFSLFEGIRHVFSSIHRAGGKVALATSKPKNPTLKLLNYFNLLHHFDAICAPEDDNTPNSKAYAIGEALKLPHQKAVMIGDRKYDAQGAEFYNLDFVAVTYGFAEPKEIESLNTTAVAHTPEELLSIFQVPPQEGKFISFEGMDGCGKTTQLQLLNQKLKQFGFRYLFTREPGGTPIAEKIRTLLLSNECKEMHAKTEALLYAASRAQHIEEVIKPSLHQGKHVLCDRFVDSSIAYQGGGRILGKTSVSQINAFAIGETKPYKTIFFNLDPKVSLARRENASELDRLESESLHFFERTKAVYDELIKEESNRFVLIDANQSIEAVFEAVFKTILTILESEEK